MRRRLGLGLLISFALGVTLLAKGDDPTPQVVIACSCKYARWACEAFWWLLC